MLVFRTVQIDEYDAFHRYLERCFGHSHGFFLRHYPDLCQLEAVDLKNLIVGVEDGEIVTHVGIFPMEVVAGPATIPCGGIGGVSTSPEARGKGYMSLIMKDALHKMRDRGLCLSVLWGDRQRYRHFGYETCGLKYELTLSKRSIEAAGGREITVEEVDPTAPEVVKHIERLQPLRRFRVERRHLKWTLARSGVRAFVSEDGYLLARGESKNLHVQEVASSSQNEPGMILGALRRTFGNHATLSVAPHHTDENARLLASASDWKVVPQGMLTVIDWPLLADSIQPLLQKAATNLKPFTISVGCKDLVGCDSGARDIGASDKDNDDVKWVTFLWDGSELKVDRSKCADQEMVLDRADLAAAIFGGPMALYNLGPLGKLLPIPIHFPSLDHV